MERINEITVSILCIVYNHEPYVKQAFEGFLMQRCNFSYEILVNEDASTDKSAEIIREYEKKYPNLFRVTYQKENQYSKGEDVLAILYRQAKGKYLAICEGDDFWTDPYKLQKQIDFLEKKEDYYAVYHNVNVVNQDGKLYPEKQFLHVLYKSHDVSFKDINCRNYLCGQTAGIVSRNFWKEFEEEQKDVFCGINSNGDVKLSVLFTNLGKVHYMEDIMACYRKAYENDSYSAVTLRKNMTYFYMNSALEVKRMLKEVLGIDFKPNLTQYALFAWEYYKVEKKKEDRKVFLDILFYHCNFIDIIKYICMRIIHKLNGKDKFYWEPLK